VLEDANIEVAARGAVWGAFANAGQACASVERCYVHDSVAKQFVEQVLKETRLLKQGVSDDSDVGAMTNERQLHIVEDHVRDAEERGAQILLGGRRVRDDEGYFYAPTVLIDVDHSMTIMREETFGPVLPIQTFKTDEEAVRLANDTVFGLTASVWTRDIARGQRLAEQIDAGTVMVNEVVYTHGIPQTPWGGVKQGGYGRTHGRMGLLEMVWPQHVHVNRVSFLPDLWWFGYGASARMLFESLASRFTTGSILATALSMPKMLARFREMRKR
jgi:succinate-semialdehyde dehydrogenase/glutarate-semialdehyde dehydrogenase